MMKKYMRYIVLLLVSMSANATSINFDKFVINQGRKSNLEQVVQSDNDNIELGLIFQVGVTGKYGGQFESAATNDQRAKIALNNVSLFNVQTQENVKWKNQMMTTENGLRGMWEAMLDPGTYSILLDLNSSASGHLVTADVSQVPIPATIYLMGAGIIGLNRFVLQKNRSESI